MSANAVQDTNNQKAEPRVDGPPSQPTIQNETKSGDVDDWGQFSAEKTCSDQSHAGSESSLAPSLNAPNHESPSTAVRNRNKNSASPAAASAMSSVSSPKAAPRPRVQAVYHTTTARFQPKKHRMNVVVVGKSGVGKTAAQRSLFGRRLEEYEGEEVDEKAAKEALSRLSSGKSTVGIDENIPSIPIELKEDGVVRDMVLLKIFDVEGYGESSHLELNWKMIMDFISKKNKQQDPIHVVLYLLDPYRLTRADQDFLSLLSENVLVIPLISKSDTISPAQKAVWQKRLFDLLVGSNIPFYHLHSSKILCISGSETGETRDYSFAQKLDLTRPEISDIREFEQLFYGNFWDIKSKAKIFKQHWEQSTAWAHIVKHAPMQVTKTVSTNVYAVCLLIFFLFSVISSYYYGQHQNPPVIYC